MTYCTVQVPGAGVDYVSVHVSGAGVDQVAVQVPGAGVEAAPGFRPLPPPLPTSGAHHPRASQSSTTIEAV